MAFSEFGNSIDCVYERFGIFQSLGRIFKKNGVLWVLETNALLSLEAKDQRKTIMLSGLARYLEKKAYQDCDILICISETLKEIVLSEFDLYPEKIIVIPNAVNTNLIDPSQYQPKRIFQDFTVGFVGTLYPWSGLDLLIETIAQLKQEGIGIHLTVVGSGPMQGAWEEFALDLGLKSKVKFMGQVPWEKVPEYIAGFDVCYSGQIKFGDKKMYLSPLKLYEYMAMAKPTIISSFEDAQRIIVHGKNGYLFEPGNKASLKDIIQHVYFHQDKLSEVGMFARRSVESNHSWTVRAKTILQEILTQRGLL